MRDELSVSMRGRVTIRLGWAATVACVMFPHATQAGPQDRVSIEVEQDGPIILGKARVKIPVVVTVPAELDDPDEIPRLTTNVGSFSRLQRIATGQYRSDFRLPADRHPQVALVAVWWKTRPTVDIPIRRIELYGRTAITVRARPGSSVVAKVGEEKFGPVETNQRGRASVPIVVPPGIDEIVVMISKGKFRRRQQVDVNVPPYNRLILVAVPDRIVPGESTEVRLLGYLDEHGRKKSAKAPELIVKAPGGELSPVATTGGRYLYRFVPAPDSERQGVKIQARVKGQPEHAAIATVFFGAGTPNTVSIVSTPERLLSDGASEGDLMIQVKDKYGNPVDDCDVHVKVAAGLVKEIESIENGYHRIRIRAPETYPPDGGILTTVSVPTDSEEPITTTVTVGVAAPPWPTSVAIRNTTVEPIADGTTPISVDVTALDASGSPYDAGDLVLVSDKGATVRLIPQGQGSYRGDLVPPAGQTEIELRARSGGRILGEPHRISLRAPPKRVHAGGRVLLGYDGAWWPGLGVQMGWVLRALRYRLAIVTGAEYRQKTFSVAAGALDGARSEVGADVGWRFFTLSAGARYELHAMPLESMLRVGANVGLLGYSTTVTPDSYASTTRRGMAPMGELNADLVRSGFFVQMAIRGLAINRADVDGPSWSLLTAIGYERGIF